MRVPQFLTEQRITFETLLHPPAFTPRKMAKYLALPGRQVAKCVLVRGPAGYRLAVLPSNLHIDAEALAKQLGGPVRLADDREVAEVFQDCEWGVVPPFGSLYGIETLLDEAFTPESEMVFEGHVHAQAIRLRCRDFERLEQPVRLRFAMTSARRVGG